MTTLSDESERTCPLCAEEMDFTDQQLKPCKCGYEICVWCWHHIIEMAEKEDAEGRCPACRTTYDKERIVGMASKCEKVVAEINGERKQKTQKAKPKASAEARKHLASVRVIQRNLVYIIGLPSTLADESMLEHREHFGQYGKVMKVSIARPATGAPPAASSNTFSVYITYAKEEEAVRCIQAVHNFILDGKQLRACFGTTKYCHTWLRNMPCSNPDCFYLHDFGSQEDSFSKDEIISAYTRSRVPQIISSSLQRRSGSALPPPVDDLCSSGNSAKIIVKSSSNSSMIPLKCSSTSSSGARSNVLPAAASWGSRTSHPISTPCLQGASKQIHEGVSLSPNTSFTVPSLNQSSSPWHDSAVKQGKLPENHIGRVDVTSKPVESSKALIDRDSKTAAPSLLDETNRARETSAWNDELTVESRSPKNAHLSTLNGFMSIGSHKSYSGDSHTSLMNSSTDVEHIASAWDDDDDVITIPTLSKRNEVAMGSQCEPVDSLKPGTGRDYGTSIKNLKVVENTSRISEIAVNNTTPATSEDTVKPYIYQQGKPFCRSGVESGMISNGNIQGLSSDMSLVNLDANSEVCNDMDKHQPSPHFNALAGFPVSKTHCIDNDLEHDTRLPLKQPSTVPVDSNVLREPNGWISDSRKHVSSLNGSETNNFEAFNNQQCSYSGVIGNAPSPSSTRSSYTSFKGAHAHTHDTIDGSKEIYSSNVVFNPSVDYDNRLRNEHQNSDNGSTSTLQSVSEYNHRSDSVNNHIGRATELSSISSSVDTREDMIISDILSMKFDPWDDTVTADNSLIKMLHETNTNVSQKTSSSWKRQNNSQSRFSFARENEPSFLRPFSNETHSNSVVQDPVGIFQNGSTTRNLESPAHYSLFQSVTTSEKNSAVSRAKVSAPPGFSAPNRAPPPGFASQDRFHQAYDSVFTPSNKNDSILTGTPAFSSVQNHYQMLPPDNAGDVEHIDPAILAAFHKGNLTSGMNPGLSVGPFSSDINISDHDPRIQLLRRQQIADSYYPKQFSGQNYSALSNFSQMPNQTSRNSYIQNPQWNGWNDSQNDNGLDMIEMLRNERRGLSRYFPSNEEHKYHISSSGELYSRSFGI